MLNDAQRANQSANMLHDALHNAVLAALLVDQATGITTDSVLHSLRTNAPDFRAGIGRLHKLPLRAEVRQLGVDGRIAGLHDLALTERQVELALNDRGAALAAMPTFQAAFEEAKTALAPDR